MNTKKSLITLILTLLLTACYSLARQTQTPEQMAKPTTILRPTSTVKVSATPSPTHTIAPTYSPQPPTAEIIPTAPLTPTTLPPFSTDTAKAVLGSFVQENGGCQLPCVLGLTPGVSNQVDLDNFIQYFQEHAHESDDLMDNVNVGFYIEDTQQFASMYFFTDTVGVSVHSAYEYSQGVIQRAALSSEAMQYSEISSTSDGSAKILYGHSYFLELLSTFTLPQVLNTYGLPEQVLIRPYPDYPGHPSPPAQYTFSFVLDFSEQGFLIEYITKREERNSQYFGCPIQPSNIRIVAWDSSLLSLEQALREFPYLEINLENRVLYQPIEKATTLSIDQFAEIYKDKITQECVSTLKEIWPTLEP
jgi:hypothetical protein